MISLEGYDAIAEVLIAEAERLALEVEDEVEDADDGEDAG